MSAKDVVCQSEARSQSRGVVVVESGAVRVARQARETQVFHARRIDKRKLASVREIGVEVPDVASIIVESA